MAETFTIPKISNGPATAATFNAPLSYIENALNQLSQGIQDFSQKDAIIQWQVPVDSSVTPGSIVYYNVSSAKYQKALAGLASQQGSSGQSLQLDSCKAQGIILSVDTTDYSATMLRSGYYESAVITGAIGQGAEAGIYYLSTTEAGKATKTPGWDVRLPVISYYGNGKFSMLSGQCAHIGDGEPVVRKINSGSLDVGSNSNGTVNIEQFPYTYAEPQVAGFAIASLQDKQIVKTPIVASLISGAGAKAVYKGSGVWSISLDSLINKPLSASDFTLNGAQRVADTLLTYTVFPRGKQASMVMTLPVDFISSTGFQGKVKVWMTTRGQGIGRYSIELYWIPYSSVSTQIASCNIGSVVLDASNTSTTKLRYTQSSTGIPITISTNGVLVAKVTASSPMLDMYVHQAGFKLDVEETSDSQAASPVTREQIVEILQEYLRFNPNYIA